MKKVNRQIEIKKRKEKRYGVCDIESVREKKVWKEIDEKMRNKGYRKGAK